MDILNVKYNHLATPFKNTNNHANKINAKYIHTDTIIFVFIFTHVCCDTQKRDELT